MTNVFTDCLPQKAKEKALKARKKRKARKKFAKKQRRLNQWQMSKI